jgi:hypothetical protein
LISRELDSQPIPARHSLTAQLDDRVCPWRRRRQVGLHEQAIRHGAEQDQDEQQPAADRSAGRPRKGPPSLLLGCHRAFSVVRPQTARHPSVRADLTTIGLGPA